VKYAKWRLSGPAETFMTSWRRVAQQGGCVDSIQCGACDGNFVQKTFFNYLFFLPSVAYGPEGRQKLDQLQKKLYKTTLFIYLFIITYKY